jgi:hypothetical protein
MSTHTDDTLVYGAPIPHVATPPMWLVPAAAAAMALLLMLMAAGIAMAGPASAPHAPQHAFTAIVTGEPFVCLGGDCRVRATLQRRDLSGPVSLEEAIRREQAARNRDPFRPSLRAYRGLDGAVVHGPLLIAKPGYVFRRTAVDQVVLRARATLMPVAVFQCGCETRHGTGCVLGFRDEAVQCVPSRPRKARCVIRIADPKPYAAWN